jgi:hypothetical protein
MLQFDNTLQSNAATYTLEQYNKETAERRRKSFLDMVLAVLLIFIGTAGLWAVV